MNYADNQTRALLEDSNEETVILIPPNKVQLAGTLIKDIEESGFVVVNMRTIRFRNVNDIEEASSIFNKSFGHAESNNEPMISVSFCGQNSIKKIDSLLSSYHEKYGKDIIHATSSEEAIRFTEFLYKERPPTATYSNCTCCVLKPHIVKSRQIGSILHYLYSNQYEISAMKLCHLNQFEAMEFFKVYEGICKEFSHMVQSLCSGPCIAMEVKVKCESNKEDYVEDEHVVVSFRRFAGPWNVDMARELHPESIRGKFGINRVENAIHCTDLKEDATHEVQYFFNVL